MWQQLTVGQFQQIQQALTDYKDDPVELEFQVLCICSGKSAEELEALATSDYNKIKRQYGFIHDQELKAEPVKHVTVNGRRYRMIYDVRKIRAHRYIEAKILEGRGVVENLHYIAASMSMPQKRTLFGWKDKEYRIDQYDKYAEDMKSCPVPAIFGSVVFFCNVFANSMVSLKDFLLVEMKKTMTEAEALQAYTHLCSAMAGITKYLSLPNTKGSPQMTPTSYP